MRSLISAKYAVKVVRAEVEMDFNFPALYFEATRLCNLQCPMCMTGSNDARKVREARRKQLNFEEIRELVLIPSQRLGVRAV
jgi:molybdenum cofactor biosynthesis enzyme MoaA